MCLFWKRDQFCLSSVGCSCNYSWLYCVFIAGFAILGSIKAFEKRLNLGSIHRGGYHIPYPQLIHGRQWEICWILDMGYRIWFVDKVEGTKNLTESEAPTIIYTIKCTYFMQGACYTYLKVTIKHHIHLDTYLGQIGYRILDIVPSSVNRAYRYCLFLCISCACACWECVDLVYNCMYVNNAIYQ